MTTVGSSNSRLTLLLWEAVTTKNEDYVIGHCLVGWCWLCLYKDAAMTTV